MGRLHEKDVRAEHEGYVVAYVPRDWDPAVAAKTLSERRPIAVLERYWHEGVDAVALRELGTMGDRMCEVHGVYVVGYACPCGWRSPYYGLGRAVDWSADQSIALPESLEENLAQRWWYPHVTAELGGSRGAKSVHVALELRRTVAVALLRWINELGNSDFNRVAARMGAQEAEDANSGLGELEDELGLQLRDRPLEGGR